MTIIPSCSERADCWRRAADWKGAVSAIQLARETGVRQQSPSRWLQEASRYDDFGLLCEPCVFAGAWNPAQSRGAVLTPMRQLCFKSHGTDSRLGVFARWA